MTSSPLAPAWLEQPRDANDLPETVWPAHALRGASGSLQLAGVDAKELAAQFGTPLYVMDDADVRARAEHARECFEREFARVGSSAKVYYAGKAFLSAEVARWVTDAGLSIDVCSGGELAVALAAGIAPERLGFHGNN
ncbi:MAG TPA: diaminopimelate decarboxylase, partial [Terrimesophilobacter sp.]|nr:diaminopimelate decarboxylase [Terrimesophilobacter sp.]